MLTRLLLITTLTIPLRAEPTTIAGAGTFAHAANLGWINFAGDGNCGAVIGQFYCSGFIYSANVGWINMGSGTPASGFAWSNTSAPDCGVNTAAYIHTGTTVEARLRGFAWGANIGWVQFEEFGDPRVDLASGQLLGDVWSANAGWLRLDSPVTVLRTTLAAGPDADADTIPDAWEYARMGELTSLHPTRDLDGDGASDRNEFLADTNPRDPADKLELLDFSASAADPGSPLRISFKWTSVLTRRYDIESTVDFSPPWAIPLGNIIPDVGASTTAGFVEPAALRKFYRITPRVPLVP